MKKTYIEPETKWLASFGDEALMQDGSPEESLPVADKDDDDEENNHDNLLSNESFSVWEED